MMKITEKKMLRIVILLATMASAVLLTAGTISAANWPEKGKQVTLYVAGGPGGGADIPGRAFTRFFEQELGVKIVIVNRAPNQVGVTEFMAKAGNDGYTMLLALTPSQNVPYLDPTRKATYSRKDFLLVAAFARMGHGVAVAKGSRFKNLKDLIDAAKANPGTIKLTASGPMTGGDLGIISLENAAGVKFAHMFYDQQGEQRAALLGGHVDGEVNATFDFIAGQKSGELVTLAVFDKKENADLPGVKTAEAQGYKAYGAPSTIGIAYKTGMPREIVDTVASAVKKVSKNPEFIDQFTKIGLTVEPMDDKAFADVWKSNEELVKAVIDGAQKK